MSGLLQASLYDGAVPRRQLLLRLPGELGQIRERRSQPSHVERAGRSEQSAASLEMVSHASMAHFAGSLLDFARLPLQLAKQERGRSRPL